METINDILREVAAEMLNTSMQDITAERIHGWATRLGEVVVAKMETTTPTCKESLQVQTMDEWAYPLTNVCKCGNNQEAKPCATVKDANGVVILHFIGIPWRSNSEAIAMATEFCERMNAQGNKVGNAAKMRQALVKILGIADHLQWRYAAMPELIAKDILELKQIAEAALAEPLRNCDVGSAEEQSARFDAFCYDHRSYEKGCENCPLLNGVPCCELSWAQMPYEEGETDEQK